MIKINNVSSDKLEEVLSLSVKLDIECQCFEGTLLDSYIFYDAERININKNVAKYIIAIVTTKNVWESNYTIILTNDLNKVDEYKNYLEGRIENVI